MVLSWIMANNKSILKLSIYIKTIAALVIIVFTTLYTNNIKTAYHDIFSGKAIRYDEEMKERYRLLSMCEEGLCDIPLRLSGYPPTIFTFDLGLSPTDEVYWYNKCLQDYIHETYTPAERKLKE